MTRDELSYCRICAAACGIVVTVDDDGLGNERVRRVRGDAEHPVSRGYTCSKGRGLAEWHHSATRLDRPRLRGRATGWEALLADLGARCNTIIDSHGPDAIALYLATGLAYDAAGQVAAASWLPSIGSRSFLTAVTVDNAPALVAAELVTGEPMLNPVWDPTAPGVTVFVGTNPVVSHGYGTALPDPVRRLRDFRAGGGRVWVLDPRSTETAASADAHLAVRPGGDVAVLAALANALLSDGADAQELQDHCDPGEVAALRVALAPFTIERAARAADVDAAAIERLVDDVRAAPGRLAMQCGTGVTMARDGVVAEWLRWVALIATGSLDRPGGMRFHRGVIRPFRARSTTRTSTALGSPPGPASRPELPRVVGQIPAVALADEIEAGNIRALFVTGGNPLTAFPQPARLRAALAQLDVLAVVDVAENECTELATHVLPATGQLERADLTLAEPTALRAGLQTTRAVVEPGADRRPVWWMFAALDAAMGRTATAPEMPNDVSEEQYLRGLLRHARLDADDVFAAGPHGIDNGTEYGWVRETFLPAGTWRIAPAPMLERLARWHDPEAHAVVMAPRREMAASNSVVYGAGNATPVVRTHPALAPPTATVTLTTPNGTITASLAEDENVRRDVVSITHGHRDANPGELTSTDDDVDPITAMPRVAGLPVRVEGLD